MQKDQHPLVFRKTRIAPTPSGFLHLGNAFSFALTAALAEKYETSILLRIDDLDGPRIEERYLQDIFDTLHFLNISWNEGPHDVGEHTQVFSQQKRMHLYEAALAHLYDRGSVYACSCSRAQLQENNHTGYPGTCRNKKIPMDAENVCWRLDTSIQKPLFVHIPEKGILQAALPAEMRDFIVRRKDGLPAYQLSSVVDDLYFGTDLVVRGEDLWASTLAQLYLSELLPANTFNTCTFFHHPLFLNAEGTKLSKSKGDTSIQHLRKQGLSAEDVYALLGKMNGNKDPVSGYRDLIP
jgi:glutamyl/glutaminyl-tRNA synthetase